MRSTQTTTETLPTSSVQFEKKPNLHPEFYMRSPCLWNKMNVAAKTLLQVFLPGLPLTPRKAWYNEIDYASRH